MSWISIDIETDGLYPPDYSMLSIGVVIVEEGLRKTFYRELKPISNNYSNDALDICGFTREQTLNFADPQLVMQEFKDWIESSNIGKPYFISDNNGFDWQFINYYFHKYIGSNPFGYNSTNLRSLYQGIKCDFKENIKHLRVTKHTHNALDDAIGNAEVLLHLSREHGLNLNI